MLSFTLIVHISHHRGEIIDLVHLRFFEALEKHKVPEQVPFFMLQNVWNWGRTAMHRIGSATDEKSPSRFDSYQFR